MMAHLCRRWIGLVAGIAVLELCAPLPAVAGEATAEVLLKSGYPINLIYGGANLGALGCPEENRPACAAEWAEYLHDFGLRSTRKSLSWLFCEMERGQEYDWTIPDKSILPMVEKGFTVVTLITDTPVWASHPKAREILRSEGRDRFIGCLSNEPEYWPDYERFLRAAVQRYGPVVDHYEVRNEPDGMCGLFPKYWEGNVGGVGMGGDPEWYAELLKRTAVIVRELDPGAQVSVGGMEDKRGLQTEFFEGLYERGCQPYFDAVAIHPYGDPFGQPFDRKWLATVRGVMARYGDEHKPMWFTEYNNEGHGELDMSFTVRRKHRLMREAPWITIAIPLGTQYMFYGKEAVNWPLRAIRQMEAGEFAARREWQQDFEGAMIRLLANWEWRAQPVGESEWPDATIESEKGRDFTAGLWVQGRPGNQRIRVCFLPYVRSDDPRIELWYAPHPKTKGTPIYVQVGAECLDVLQPERLTDVVDTATEAFVFRPLRLRIADHWPDWQDQGLNMVWAEFSSPEPGFSLAVDDVWVH